jgi:O-succinylbenzoic acid--CoA ligase
MASIRRGDLVAVAMPQGPDWLHAVRTVWDAGAALFPLDPRRGPGPAGELMASSRPTALMDAAGLRRLRRGVPVDPDVCLVVFTSGTTGGPKVAELTGSALRAAVEGSASRLHATADDGWLGCLPPWHMGGLLVLARALLLGAPVDLHRRFDERAFDRARRSVFTSVVPTMLVRLVAAGTDLSRFRAILVGGAALAEGPADSTPPKARLVLTYGLTESCGGVVYDGIPLDGVEMRLGDEGEIQLRGPTLFRGYRLDPEATRRAFTPDGWLRTRDAGTLVRGKLRVLGRLDERIVTGGEKVWPGEVERALREDPAIQGAMVVGRPDPEWGERVVAVVVPADPTHPPTLDQVRRLVADHVAFYAAPRQLRLVKRLPRTRAGKLRRGPTRPTSDTTSTP